FPYATLLRSVGLHHSVLDAVVDHLGEMPRTAGPDMAPTAIRRRSQALEHRTQPRRGPGVAADHQAVAFLQPPDAAAGAAVQQVHAGVAAAPAATLAVAVVGVAAV